MFYQEADVKKHNDEEVPPTGPPLSFSKRVCVEAKAARRSEVTHGGRARQPARGPAAAEATIAAGSFEFEFLLNNNNRNEQKKKKHYTGNC
jgi:hypothetical protein